MRGLYLRLTIAFIAITSGILLISTLMFIFETHYHFSMYQHQAMDMNADTAAFNAHFEQALVQSVLWTFVVGVFVAAAVSLFVAKRITNPLIQMKEVAEQMAKGGTHVRTNLTGSDELTDLGRSLNHLADQLNKQEQLRKMMTADVAHELRTPLATLKSHILALIDGIWEPTPKRLAACYEEVERLTHLVGDLRNLTEIESPNFELQLEREDLTTVVTRNVEVAKAAFAEKGVWLEVLNSDPVFAYIDRNRVGQIISNLLSNALKFTPEGGSVTIRTEQLPDGAAIIVSDTGSGIREDELPLVFERFYRGEKSRNRTSGGGGIGLAIVKGIVEAHRGEIKIESKESKGTQVHLVFKNEEKLRVNGFLKN